MWTSTSHFHHAQSPGHLEYINGEGQKWYGGEIWCLSTFSAWCFWLTCKMFEPRHVSWHHASHHQQQHPTFPAPLTLKYTSPVRRHDNSKVRNGWEHLYFYCLTNSPDFATSLQDLFKPMVRSETSFATVLSIFQPFPINSAKLLHISHIQYSPAEQPIKWE